jgi:hypothetical protein
MAGLPHETDPVAYICGLLGILRADAIPDYAKSVWKVHTDFLLDLILEFRSFELLGKFIARTA